jgi:hypothetical protein
MCEESEEVSIIKSVPNWISYLHQFSQIFLTFHLFFLHEKTDFGFIILENPLTRGGGHLSASFSHCAWARMSETFSHLETMRRRSRTTRRCSLILAIRTSFTGPSDHSSDCHCCSPPPVTVRQSIVRELCLTAAA